MRYLRFLLFFCLLPAFMAADLPGYIFKIIEGRDPKIQLRLLDSLADVSRNKDFPLSVEISKYGLAIARKNNLHTGTVKTYIALCRSYRSKGIYDTAMIYVDSAKAFAFTHSVTEQYANVYDFQGLVHMRLGEYEKATVCFYTCIGYAEKTKDSLKLHQAFEHLGSVAFYRHDHKSAVKFYKKALSYFSSKSSPRIYFSTLDNIGLAYSNLKMMDSALHYQKKGVTALEALHDSVVMAESYVNIGSTLLELKNFKESEFYFIKASSIHTRLKNTYGMQISTLYLGRLYLKLGSPQTALPYLESAYAISLKLQIPAQIKESLSSLTTAYYAVGNYKRAAEFYELLVNTMEKISAEENIKAINELSTKYETGKKQQEIQLLQSEKEVQVQRIAKDRYVKLFIAALAASLLILSLVFIYRFRKKKKDHAVLIRKNQAIAMQKEKIETQKEQLQKKNEEITDSINYAKRIQSSVLPSPSLVKKILPDSFIYFSPKDIVSGDFYWLCEARGYIFCAVADCTGHGVPGAMMSMLGASLLNQIVLDSNVIVPSEILKELHFNVLKTLNENMQQQESKDGMDIALIRIDKSKKEVLYSGAGRPLYIIQNKNLITYKPDKHPIGETNYSGDLNYKLTDISFSEPLQLYLFSDGVPDQFGGPANKKLMTRHLLDMLLQSSALTVAGQEAQFIKFFEDWKSGFEQTDDVTLVAIRLS